MRVSIPKGRRLGVVAAVAALLVAVPVVVLAQSFTDVPPTNTFYNDIEAVKAAGVTSGCTATTYCPKAYVTREQMAAFLNRLGALSASKPPVVNADRLDGYDSSQFARSDGSHAFSCGVDSLHPEGNTTTDANAALRWVVSGADSIACGVHIPDGATVVGLYAFVYDNTASGNVTCSLTRVHLADGTVTVMALTPSTSGTPLFTELQDSTVTAASIDNNLYTYSAGCDLPITSQTMGVRSIAVSYHGAP